MIKKWHFTKCANHEKHENVKCIKCENVKTCVKILRLGRGGHFSALKPGPVVPPGTQKTPDQAARISQSVDFGHLSDILGFLGGGSIFDHFFVIFLCF